VSPTRPPPLPLACALEAPTVVCLDLDMTATGIAPARRLKPTPPCAIRGGGGQRAISSLVLAVRDAAGEAGPPRALPGPRAVVGRGADCDVELAFQGAADGPRLMFAEEKERSFVAALGHHEVRLNGRRLTEQLKTVLLPGDRLEVDGLELTVRAAADLAESTEEYARHLSRDLLHGTGPKPSLTPHLLVMNGPAEGTAVPLSGRRGQLVLGRGEGCDVVLDDEDASRRHARLSWKDNLLAVEDLASRNGTLVNGGRTGGRTPLADRDDLLLGSTRLTLVVPPPVEPEPTALAEFEPTRSPETPAPETTSDNAPDSEAPHRETTADWLLVGLGLLLAAAATAVLVWILG